MASQPSTTVPGRVTFSVSLDPALLKELDEKVDRRYVLSRSHAISIAISEWVAAASNA